MNDGIGLFHEAHASDGRAIEALLDDLSAAALAEWVCEAGRFEGQWSMQAFGLYAIAFHRSIYVAETFDVLPWQKLLQCAAEFRGRLRVGPLGTVLGICDVALEVGPAWTEADKKRLLTLIGRGLLLDSVVQDGALNTLAAARLEFGDQWGDPSWRALVVTAEQIARAELEY